MMIPNTILKIGSQELVPLGDHFRFVIQEVMPERGFKFKFGIRDRILEEVMKRGQRLEVCFGEFPDISFNLNPLQWISLGRKRKQIGLFKNDPMWFYWFFVGFNNELTSKKVLEGQQGLFT